MARFRYRATDEHGQPVAGDTQAESLEAARLELAGRNWQVSELALVSETSSAKVESLDSISNADAAVLAEQIANVTSAGLPLSAGLRALAEEIPGRRMQRWLRSLGNRLERGQSLSSIADEADGAWPRYFLAMLDAGQRTGRLPELLNECVVHLRATAELKRQLWVGSVYPAALIMACWFLLSFIMWYVIPQFKSIFLGFGTELPAITIGIIQLSDVMRIFDWWFLPALIFGTWIAWRLCAKLGFGRQRDALVSQIPFWGEVRRTGALAEFFRLLSLLVRYQVPLSEAIRIAAGSLSDADLRDACLEVAKRVEAGQSLADSAEETGRFPVDSLHLFRWADQGEHFADGLQKASEILAHQCRIQANTLALVYEPTVTVMVGMGVGLIVIALFMPLVKLLNDLS